MTVLLCAILYSLVASVCFTLFYIGHCKINEGYLDRRLMGDESSVWFALLTSMCWPVTVWFAAPYLIVNLYQCGYFKKDKK